MKYGRILSDAWTALWRSWALWGFVGTWFAATALVFVGVMVGLAGVMFAGITALEAGGPDPASLLVFVVIGLVSSLVMVPLFWLFHGGAIHLSNEALESRPVTFGGGWRAGTRRFGALAGFELLSYLVLLAVGGTLGAVILLMFVTVVTSGDSEGAIGAAILGLCLMYMIGFVVYMVMILFIQAFEAVGARAAVLSGRGGVAAFKDAWSAIRHSFKNVLVMGLIVLGVTMAYSMVTSMVLTPLQLVFMPQMMMDPTVVETDPAAFMSSFGTMYAVIGTASMLLSFPMTIFIYLVWTAFYRQLVGMAPAEEPAPPYGSPAPLPVEPAAPAPPAPATPEIPAPPAPPGLLPEPPAGPGDGS